MSVLEIYSELRSKEYLREDGLLNLEKVRGTRKLVAFKYWAMIKIINGEWKYGLNAKRIEKLDSEFKNKSIEQICEYINEQIIEKGYKTSNECIDCFKAGFNAADQGKHLNVKITPIIKFKTKEGDISSLINATAAVKIKEKNK